MIELNCDMGEGMPHEEQIMPLIHSANIACGFHAGNSDSIRRSIQLALRHQVKIGAHPSFRDKENFGRREMNLPEDKLYALVLEQLIRIDLIAKECGAEIRHVKPHGALYNMAARDPQIARIVATAVKDFDDSLVIYGLSGSCMIRMAKDAGLAFANEVFADRLYNDDGSLVSRHINKAVIHDMETALLQARQLIEHGSVNTITGNTIQLKADTICLHGDGVHSKRLALEMHNMLERAVSSS